MGGKRRSRREKLGNKYKNLNWSHYEAGRGDMGVALLGEDRMDRCFRLRERYQEKEIVRESKRERKISRPTWSAVSLPCYFALVMF